MVTACVGYNRVCNIPFWNWSLPAVWTPINVLRTDVSVLSNSNFAWWYLILSFKSLVHANFNAVLGQILKSCSQRIARMKVNDQCIEHFVCLLLTCIICWHILYICMYVSYPWQDKLLSLCWPAVLWYFHHLCMGYSGLCKLRQQCHNERRGEGSIIICLTNYYIMHEIYCELTQDDYHCIKVTSYQFIYWFNGCGQKII